MASARSASPDRASAAGGKRGFAKRARSFAKRAAGLPGFPYLWIGCAAAAGIMTVTGGFGTIGIPLGQRALFWLLLMAWALLKWQLWFVATVRKPRDWMRAAILGGVLLNVPLPLETTIAAAAVGIPSNLDLLGTWGHALAISAVVLATILLLIWVARRRGIIGRRVLAPPPDGLLHRARVTPESVAAIEAEDHYCRVRRSDGSDALIHYRFGDALGEVGGIDGQQVHRGAWVASRAVSGAIREGRRWLLVLVDGSKVPVSATHLADVRARGWLVAPP